MFIDSHCHIHLPILMNKIQEIIKNIHLNNIPCALCVSINLESFKSLLKVVNSYKNIYGSVGIHPNYNNNFIININKLIKLSKNKKIIAIGETGLDYYNIKNNNEIKLQQKRFRTHIRAAIKTKKPLIIHTRNSSDDLLKIIIEENAKKVGGIIHCFTDSLLFAQKFIEQNFYISFSGIVTFKNSKNIQKVSRKIQLNRILIETDSPYLTPTPHRGKINEPSYVIHTGNFIAKQKKISNKELSMNITKNFNKLFNLNIENKILY